MGVILASLLALALTSEPLCSALRPSYKDKMGQTQFANEETEGSKDLLRNTTLLVEDVCGGYKFLREAESFAEATHPAYFATDIETMEKAFVFKKQRFANHKLPMPKKGPNEPWSECMINEKLRLEGGVRGPGCAADDETGILLHALMEDDSGERKARPAKSLKKMLVKWVRTLSQEELQARLKAVVTGILSQTERSLIAGIWAPDHNPGNFLLPGLTRGDFAKVALIDFGVMGQVESSTQVYESFEAIPDDYKRAAFGPVALSPAFNFLDVEGPQSVAVYEAVQELIAENLKSVPFVKGELSRALAKAGLKAFVARNDYFGATEILKTTRGYGDLDLQSWAKGGDGGGEFSSSPASRALLPDAPLTTESLTPETLSLGLIRRLRTQTGKRDQEIRHGFYDFLKGSAEPLLKVATGEQKVRFADTIAKFENGQGSDGESVANDIVSMSAIVEAFQAQRYALQHFGLRQDAGRDVTVEDIDVLLQCLQK